MKTQDGMGGLPGGAVRISMPAKVANDLDTFKKGVVAFAERIGCPECFSGLDCTFESEREFVIEPDLDVRASKDDPRRGVSSGAGDRTVTMSLTPGAEFQLDKILELIDIIGKKIGGHWEDGGPGWCCSGYDMRFERELQIMADGDGNIRR